MVNIPNLESTGTPRFHRGLSIETEAIRLEGTSVLSMPSHTSDPASWDNSHTLIAGTVLYRSNLGPGVIRYYDENGDWWSVAMAADNGGAVTISASTPSPTHTGMLWLDTSVTGAQPDLVPVVLKTGAYTATTTDYVILCDASGGAFTVTLPTAAGNTGKIYHVKKIDSSGFTVTLDGNGSETIDDTTTKILVAQYDSIQIVSDGTEWWII